jgi:hypothetical protein
MQKKVKDRVAKRTARKLKREEGNIDAAINSVNQRHNMEEGKFLLRSEDFSQSRC